MKIINTLALSFLLPSLVLGEESQASVVLNKDNYDDKISKGLWFIKFYAPWCKFSKRLAPTWEKFTEAQKELTKDGSFNFGEVDCQENSDLCTRFEVDGYPTLFLQNKQGTIEEYTEGQSVEELTKYVKEKIKSASSNTSNKPEEIKPQAPVVEKVVEAPVNKVQVESSDSYDYPNVKGKVKELNGDEFQKAVDTKATWIMKFFSPTCPHCQAMIKIYQNLAYLYKDKVNFGEIDCTKNQELCSEQGAKGVPYFKIFYKGKGESDMIGEKTQEELRSLIQEFITPTFDEYNSKDIKSLENDSEPTLVYLGDGKDDEAYKTKFQEKMVGLDLMTDKVIYSKDSELKSSLSTKLKEFPTLFMISKDGVFEFGFSINEFETLKSWIDIHKYPLDYELTPSSLQQAIKKYIIVLSLSENGEPSRDLATAAKKYREEPDSINKAPVLFSHGSKDLIQSLYILGVPKPSSYPYTVVLNPTKGVYFDKEESGDKIELNSDHLIPTLHSIQENKIQGETLVPKTGNFIRDHFYIVIFGVLGVGVVGYMLYKRRNGGFQYRKVE